VLKIIAVGRVRERFVQEGLSVYLERLGRFASIRVAEIKDSNMDEEGESILKSLGDDYAVILDVKGRKMSSEEFCAFLKKNMYRTVSFVIGGPEGLPDAVKERADYALSLSEMTLTHEMARLVLTEQIYRAYTIMKGIKYHK
jgi:23S rRNA (pseudouridine1915-N3)-methyltransferase